MTETALDVRQWLYRYLQQHIGLFDSPAWQVPGDEYIPKLTNALEGLADYVSRIDDGDERLAALADALNAAQLTPEVMESTLYPHRD